MMALGIKDISGDEDEIDGAGVVGRQHRVDELRGNRRLGSNF